MGPLAALWAAGKKVRPSFTLRLGMWVPAMQSTRLGGRRHEHHPATGTPPLQGQARLTWASFPAGSQPVLWRDEDPPPGSGPE